MSAEPPPDLELAGEPRPWELPQGAPQRFEPAGLYLGNGPNPLEVAVARSNGRPASGDVRKLWEKRHARRASPLLCVAVYEHNGTWRAGVCGPAGGDPRVVLDLDLGQTGRVCSAALAEPDRHSATRFLLETLPGDDADLPGLRNVGMFATHHLRSGVPQRTDWEGACEAGRAMLDRQDRSLVEGLGFAIERRDTSTSLLRVDGATRAVAVFLQQSETPEGVGQRYGGVSPAAHALAAADREDLPYAVLTRGRQIRVYATGSDIGVGRKGRAETFVELNLAVLPTGAAGYLPLIFGAQALKRGGTFEEILERSRDFATGLGVRLRDRVYEEAVPALARAVAARHADEAEPDLDLLYEQTLVILFRLLFIAYAEDKDLLPYRTSGEYSRHALKTLARDLADRLNEGRDTFDQHATDLWAEVKQVFRAVELGNDDWQVPRYGGSLFSSEQEVSAAGAAIETLDLTNAELGPALNALLIDRAQEGQFGAVDFQSLSVREFGTIYEGLLESSLAVAPRDLALAPDRSYVPASGDDAVEVAASEIYLHNRSGARKATGSYFTKPFAVEHLLDQALEPALDAHLDRLGELMDAGDEAGAGVAFFDFRCADIAMGSGHFLVAAVDRIEARLSRFLAERPVPSVIAELERLRKAAEDQLGDLSASIEIEHSSLLRRQAARRCVYGVDQNQVAVELARLALWIHTFVPGLPLGFLDHSLVRGDSLSGIPSMDRAVELLEPTVGPRGTVSVFRQQIAEWLGNARASLRRLSRATDATAAEIAVAREAQAEARSQVESARKLFDLLLAAFLDRAQLPDQLSDEIIENHPDLQAAEQLSNELVALHFPIAFPEVFLSEKPGFDCILGNPPWDKVRFEPQQFWVTRSPGLNALPAADREPAIETLREERPTDAQIEVADREERERYQAYVKNAFEHQGRGHYDLAKLFLERSVALLEANGCLGYVLPRQALVLGGWGQLRALMLEHSRLRTLQARNRGGWLFEDIDHRIMIVLMSRVPVALTGGAPGVDIWPTVESVQELNQATLETAVPMDQQELAASSDSLVIPWFESNRAASVFDAMRRQPSLASGDGWVEAISDSRWDFSGSGGHREFCGPTEETGAWKVLMARHVRQFEIDEDAAYQRFIAEPGRLVSLRLGVVGETRSETLAEDHPLIVYRYPSRNDDARTVIAAPLPDHGFLPSTGYVHGLRHSEAADTESLLALLGCLNSFSCDWWARRVTDRHVTAPVINNIALPNWDESDRRLASTLAAELVIRGGLENLAGSRHVQATDFSAESREQLLARLEVLTANGFGLSGADLRMILEDFSERGCPADLRQAIIREADDAGL